MVGTRTNPVTVPVEFVVVLGPTQGYTCKTAPVFKPLYGIDAEHGLAELGVEFIKDRFTQPYRRVSYNTGDYPPDRIAVKPYLIDQFNHPGSGLFMRAPYHVVVGSGKIEGLVWRRDNVAHPRYVGINSNAQCLQVQLGYRPSCDTRCGFTR